MSAAATCAQERILAAVSVESAKWVVTRETRFPHTQGLRDTPSLTGASSL